VWCARPGNQAGTMTSTPVPPGSVVVAVDGSAHADRAIDWGVEYARATRRRLALVHAAPSSEPPGVLTDASRRALARADELDPDGGLAVSVHLLDDDPRDALRDLSEDADLLVLGSRGLGTVRSVLLGSVSGSVARHAVCPVVVCRPQQHPAPVEDRVVVGADGDPASYPVLEFAFEQASLRACPLTVMHVFWDVLSATNGPGLVTTRGDDDLDDPRMLLAEAVAGLQEKYPDVTVTRELSRGLVDDALADRSTDATLLVVGRSDVGAPARWLHSSCALAVLERAHTTVAVVPETT
jgi:nucleotide-binding universal stress UspA family protein